MRFHEHFLIHYFLFINGTFQIHTIEQFCLMILRFNDFDASFPLKMLIKNEVSVFLPLQKIMVIFFHLSDFFGDYMVFKMLIWFLCSMEVTLSFLLSYQELQFLYLLLFKSVILNIDFTSELSLFIELNHILFDPFLTFERLVCF